MNFPENFLFSQGNLQDYIECKMRFYLRYILHLTWPALQSERASEYQRLLRKGENFHHIIHQHIVGVPVNKLEVMVTGLNLEEWWENYLFFYKSIIFSKAIAYPETAIIGRIRKFRLMARYDLILVEGTKIRIIDWKTSQKRTDRSSLENRMQTRVYPFLLTQAGNDLLEQSSIKPEQIEMIYWYAEYPEQPEIFTYDQEKYEEDQRFLDELVAEIALLGEEGFTRVDEIDRCRYCAFRSFCDRGVQPGNLAEMSDAGLEEDEVFSLDFETIPEIELIPGSMNYELD